MSKDPNGYYLVPTSDEEVTEIEDAYTTEEGRIAKHHSKIWSISPWTRVHVQFNVANHVAQCKGDCRSRSESKFSPWNCIVKCRYSQDHWILSCHKQQHESVCHLNYNIEIPPTEKNYGGLIEIRIAAENLKQRYYEQMDPDNCGDLTDKLVPIVVNCRHCRLFVTLTEYICPNCFLLNPQQLFQFFSKLPNLLVNTVKGPADQQYADYLNKIIKELAPDKFNPPALPVTKSNQPIKIKPEFKPEVPQPPPIVDTKPLGNNNNNNNNVPTFNGDEECQVIEAPLKRKVEDDSRSNDRYFVIPDDDDEKPSTTDTTEGDSFYFQKRKKQKTTHLD